MLYFEVLCCSSLVMVGRQKLRPRTSQLLLHYELLLPCCVISCNLHALYYFAFLIGPTHYGTVGQLTGTSQKGVRKKQTLPKLQSLLPSHHQHGPWCGWYHLQIVNCLIRWTQRSVKSCNAGNRQDTEGVKLSMLLGRITVGFSRNTYNPRAPFIPCAAEPEEGKKNYKGDQTSPSYTSFLGIFCARM